MEKAEPFQYVPLIENLKWVFQNSEVCHEVRAFLIALITGLLLTPFVLMISNASIKDSKTKCSKGGSGNKVILSMVIFIYTIVRLGI